jgi:hypothetical protein
MCTPIGTDPTAATLIPLILETPEKWNIISNFIIEIISKKKGEERKR